MTKKDEEVLARFIHVSDLHFGHVLGGADAKPRDARIPRLCRNPLVGVVFDGLMGHHGEGVDALLQLAEAQWPVKSASANSHYCLVSGDLTRNGHEDQFDLVRKVLGGESAPLIENPGPKMTGSSVFMIPGNHDHWPGNDSIFGQPKIDLINYFDTPSITRINLKDSVGARYLIEILRINTDKDVFPYWKDRLFARGEFVSHLDALSKLIEVSNGRSADAPIPIRVLMMHHSPSYGGEGGALRILEINEACSKSLRDFIAKNKIVIVLTGHVHRPAIRILEAWPKSSSQPWRFLEVRCGSTTSRDAFPDNWKIARTPEPNTAVLHDLALTAGRLKWRVRVLWRVPEAGFLSRADLLSGSYQKVEMVKEIPDVEVTVHPVEDTGVANSFTPIV